MELCAVETPTSLLIDGVCVPEFSLRRALLYGFYSIPKPVRRGVASLIRWSIEYFHHCVELSYWLTKDLISAGLNGARFVTIVPIAWSWAVFVHVFEHFFKPVMYFVIFASLIGAAAGVVGATAVVIVKALFPDPPPDQHNVDGQGIGDVESMEQAWKRLKKTVVDEVTNVTS
uniref:ARAD1A05324p n=1 Tax=Blastobotrys adeninivorans TaxID=409370 RepID=A0A060SWJ1_BLAAD